MWTRREGFTADNDHRGKQSMRSMTEQSRESQMLTHSHYTSIGGNDYSKVHPIKVMQ